MLPEISQTYPRAVPVIPVTSTVPVPPQRFPKSPSGPRCHPAVSQCFTVASQHLSAVSRCHPAVSQRFPVMSQCHLAVSQWFPVVPSVAGSPQFYSSDPIPVSPRHLQSPCSPLGTARFFTGPPSTVPVLPEPSQSIPELPSTIPVSHRSSQYRSSAPQEQSMNIQSFSESPRDIPVPHKASSTNQYLHGCTSDIPELPSTAPVSLGTGPLPPELLSMAPEPSGNIPVPSVINQCISEPSCDIPSALWCYLNTSQSFPVSPQSPSDNPVPPRASQCLCRDIPEIPSTAPVPSGDIPVPPRSSW